MNYTELEQKLGKQTKSDFATLCRENCRENQFMKYTDTQLKQALAKMLPECVYVNGYLYIFCADFAGLGGHCQVRDTELLHLCWLVEKMLTRPEITSYSDDMADYWWSPFHASWQQRVESLAKVKGIEI